MVVSATSAAEPLLWVDEIEHRRGRRLFAVALCTAIAGVVISLLIDADARDVPDTALTFWVTIYAVAVGLGAIVVVLVESQQIEYARACLRYFAGPPPETLTTLRGDVRWCPGGTLPDSTTLLTGVTAFAAAGTAVAYLSISHHGWGPILAVTVLAISCILLAVEGAFRKLPGWKTAIEELADGVATLRAKTATDATVRGAQTLVRIGDDLCVREDDKLPAPELTAQAYFGAGAYEDTHRGQAGWTRFTRKAAADEPSPRAIAPADQPLSRRLGRPAAVVLAVLAAILLAVSVVRGAPHDLPGWALESPLLYEAARAGLGLLGVLVLTNLLAALAAGRLVSKVSQTGLELDAASPEDVAEGDAKSEQALKQLETQVTLNTSGLELVAHQLRELAALREDVDRLKEG